MNMTKRCRSLILFAFAVVCLTQFASSQTEKRLSSTPKDFQTFYAKFKGAVIRKDKQAVAAMTVFPFKYGWDAGDEGTYSRSRFLANFTRIFSNNQKIFRQANPSFSVDGKHLDLLDETDASHYGFVKTAAGYKFVSMIVEP
jgi:hypothetical protein